MNDEEKIINIIESISAKLLHLKMEKLSNLKGLDLSANHFQYISILDKLGKTTFTELAQNLQISKPAVTSFIDKLLKQKIVVKTQSDEDKRFFFIELSKKGKQIAEVYNNALLTFANNLKSSMSDEEFKQLITIMDKGLK